MKKFVVMFVTKPKAEFLCFEFGSSYGALGEKDSWEIKHINENTVDMMSLPKLSGAYYIIESNNELAFHLNENTRNERRITKNPYRAIQLLVAPKESFDITLI